MTMPGSADSAPEPPRLPAEPTVRVARPPVPAPTKRPDVAAAGGSPLSAGPEEDPTVGLPGHAPRYRQRTIEFGTPPPVKVTVGPRPRRRRRYRTWPYIAAVVLALLALGITLLVMLLRGATIDAGTDLIGSGDSGARSPASCGRRRDPPRAAVGIARTRPADPGEARYRSPAQRRRSVGRPGPVRSAQ